MRWRRGAAVVVMLLACSCASESDDGSTSQQNVAGAGGSGVGGVGGAGGAGAMGGMGGAGGGISKLDALLAALRSDRDGALQTQSDGEGWPAPVEDGLLFVSADPTLDHVAGDHDSWQGSTMNADQGFSWLVIDVPAGSRYKLMTAATFVADPWSRAYEHDSFGVMSMVAPIGAHLERFLNVGDASMAPRTVRVWVPAEAPTHLLYLHDGQNLFDPDAPWGGWAIQDSAPGPMMLIGIDNTASRMDEYTHVVDDIGGLVGGQGDAYADFVNTTVRALVAARYGEPPRIGVMGSSLGGLIAFHIANRHAGVYHFAASMSGTMGWGSIGLGGGMQNETMIQRYQTQGLGNTALYLDSGGSASTCVDSDGDGTEDDGDGTDNYCENNQLEAVVLAVGYTADIDMWHWWEQDAPHNEAAWAARVWRPLGLFAAL